MNIPLAAIQIGQVQESGRSENSIPAAVSPSPVSGLYICPQILHLIIFMPQTLYLFPKDPTACRYPGLSVYYFPDNCRWRHLSDNSDPRQYIGLNPTF